MSTYMTEVSAAYKHLFGFKKEKKQNTDNSTVTLRKTPVSLPSMSVLYRDLSSKSAISSSRRKPGAAPHTSSEDPPNPAPLPRAP